METETESEPFTKFCSKQSHPTDQAHLPDTAVSRRSCNFPQILTWWTCTGYNVTQKKSPHPRRITTHSHPGLKSFLDMLGPTPSLQFLKLSRFIPNCDFEGGRILARTSCMPGFQIFCIWRFVGSACQELSTSQRTLYVRPQPTFGWSPIRHRTTDFLEESQVSFPELNSTTQQLWLSISQLE